MKLVKQVGQDIVIIMKDKKLMSSRPILKDDSRYNTIILKKSERVIYFQSLVLSLQRSKKESDIDEVLIYQQIENRIHSYAQGFLSESN